MDWAVFSGICISLAGISTNLIFICGAFFMLFATLPFINTGAEVLVRKSIPNEAQGRAWGFIGIISQLGNIVAYAIAGVLADKIFSPLLMENGALADSVGAVIGIGEGRGIGFLYILCGIFVSLCALVISRQGSIKSLNN